MFKDIREAGRLGVLLVVAFALALTPLALASASPSGSKSSDRPAVNVDAQIAELTQMINAMDGLSQAEKDRLAGKVTKEFTEMARDAAKAGMTPDDLLALVKQAVASGTSLKKAMEQVEKQVDKAQKQLEKERERQKEQEKQQEEEEEKQQEQQKERHEEQAEEHDNDNDNDNDNDDDNDNDNGQHDAGGKSHD